LKICKLKIPPECSEVRLAHWTKPRVNVRGNKRVAAWLKQFSQKNLTICWKLWRTLGEIRQVYP